MDHIPLQDYDQRPSAYYAHQELSLQRVIKPDHILLASTRLPDPEPQPVRKNPVKKDPFIEEIEAQLLGRSFAVSVRKEKLQLGDSVFKIPVYSFKDASVMGMLKSLAKTDNIRVLFPGAVVNRGYEADRVNFVFDEKGAFQRCVKG